MNTFLKAHYYKVVGEPRDDDCAFDAVRMSFAAMVIRYPKAFNMSYCVNLDLSILGIRNQLSMLIETNALYRLSDAIDMKMTVDSYMFQYDQYGNKGVYAKRPGEEETQWLSRAAA